MAEDELHIGILGGYLNILLKTRCAILLEKEITVVLQVLKTLKKSIKREIKLLIKNKLFLLFSVMRRSLRNEG